MSFQDPIWPFARNPNRKESIEEEQSLKGQGSGNREVSLRPVPCAPKEEPCCLLTLCYVWAGAILLLGAFRTRRAAGGIDDLEWKGRELASLLLPTSYLLTCNNSTLHPWHAPWRPSPRGSTRGTMLPATHRGRSRGRCR